MKSIIWWAHKVVLDIRQILLMYRSLYLLEVAIVLIGEVTRL